MVLLRWLRGGLGRERENTLELVWIEGQRKRTSEADAELADSVESDVGEWPSLLRILVQGRRGR